MANPHSVSQSSELRSEFKAKDGVYKNLKTHQLSKPRAQPLLGKELSETRVSLVSVKDMQGLSEWIVFNSGRELLCYPFHGTQQPTDLSSPVDKHAYRSSYPISHDINVCTRSSEQIDLIVGFNGGPIQHFNPLSKSCLGTYNADRQIDPSDVTCIKWVPGSETQFVASHRSGRLFVWTTEYLYKGSNLPTFHIHKQLKDTVIYVCKPKKGSSLVSRWDIGHGSIQRFEFSPDTTHLAVVNQDGFLRVYNFATQELYSRMRSYYGGFLCVCWSPDGKYIVTGGEDDLISVWSFEEKHVLARGQGHKSYVTSVAFDPYTSETNPLVSRHPSLTDLASASTSEFKSQRSSRFFPEENRAYRLGSVGQDGLLCLWELSGDSLSIVRRMHGRTRSRVINKQTSAVQLSGEDVKGEVEATDEAVDRMRSPSVNEGNSDSVLTTSINSNVSKKSNDKGSKAKKKQKKKHKSVSDDDSKSVELQSPTDQSKGETLFEDENKSKAKDNKKPKSGSEKTHKKLAVRNMVTKFINGSSVNSSTRTVSQFESCQSDDIAPSMQDINLIEPLVCKTIWRERLTDVMFREDCLLVATQDGFVQVWGRPGFMDDCTVSLTPSNPGLNSPKTGGADSKHTSV